MGIHVLCDVVTRHIEATNTIKATSDGSSNNETWWKIREASIMTLSISRDIIVEKQQAGALQFDFVRFLDTVVLGMLNDSGTISYVSLFPNFLIDGSKYCKSCILCIYSFYLDSPPLLLGRCLCFGGRYAQIMPPEVSSRFLEAAVNGLQENQPSCIRISAVKAIYWFCETPSEKGITNIISCHLPNIFRGLFNLASQPSTDVLTLVMETFHELVAVSTNQFFSSAFLSDTSFFRYSSYLGLICVYSYIKNLQHQWKTRFVL